jgi:hypothetical protein
VALATTAIRNLLASAYASNAPYAALYTTAPGGTAGTEVSGGGYARQALTWSTPSNGAITATATFNVPAGATIAGTGIHSASTGGTYLDGGTVTSQNFATAGTYTVTITYTQS